MAKNDGLTESKSSCAIVPSLPQNYFTIPVNPELASLTSPNNCRICILESQCLDCECNISKYTLSIPRIFQVLLNEGRITNFNILQLHISIQANVWLKSHILFYTSSIFYYQVLLWPDALFLFTFFRVSSISAREDAGCVSAVKRDMFPSEPVSGPLLQAGRGRCPQP